MPMTLDEMKAIAAKRTKGEWILDQANYADGLAVGDKYAFYLQNSYDIRFIAMCANSFDKLIAVAEAAKKLLNYWSNHYNYHGDSFLVLEEYRNDVDVALNALKGTP